MADSNRPIVSEAPELPLVSVVTVVRNRARPLADTIESVMAQTYPRVEHIVVDGASDDDTLDVIRRYEPHLARWISEPDEGIYDAINKGIRLCTGQYALIVHAADTLSPDYVERLVARKMNSDADIVYGKYRHGTRSVPTSPVSEGLLFHYLGLNHQAFLAPLALYERLGGYDRNLRIVSDAIWMRKAFLEDVTFEEDDADGFHFAEGGLSSGQTEAHRELVISEHVAAYRINFPWLNESVARRIYLYRFDESYGQAILKYLESLPAHEGAALFIGGLGRMMIHVWGLRSLKDADGTTVNVRLRLAERLGLDPRDCGIHHKDEALASWLDAIDDLKGRVGERPVALHYLEVFSRPSETFIPDLISRMEAADGAAHVVLCDKRVLASERPYDLLFAFDFSAYSEAFGRYVIEALIEALAPKGLVFHFATNGWRLLSRIDRRFRRLPAVYMTHGVDVFDLKKDSDCTRFILKEASLLPNTRFTAVSRYLADALAEAGVPANKTSVVHNAVHDRFRAHRQPGSQKTEARASAGHAARLINIGRMVGWKGQDDLLVAVGLLRKQGIEVSLTIVYGKADQELGRLREVAAREGVSDLVMFRESVNFDAEPDFLNGFDLLVSASRYSGGVASRSETFGMSILEGIAAGLPVVVTDAGGQPEVAGEPNAYVRIARHADPESLAAEIRTVIESGALDGDNREVAEERLARFSQASQIAKLTAAMAEARCGSVRPLLLTTAVDKGAGGAAQGVHRALLKAGYASNLRFRNLVKGWQDIAAAEPLRRAPRHMGDVAHPTGAFLRPGHTIFSVDTDGIGRESLEALIADADVINLHWYARFVSNEDIAWLSKTGKPVILTIRDMHPLTGGCHFFHSCDRWKHDCLPCPQFQPEDVHLPHQVFEQKRADWNFDNITVVTLSEHTRRIVEQSPLLSNCRIETIPNPIDLVRFHPVDPAAAREKLGLPADRKIIAYMPSFDSKVKGADEFQAMLKRLSRDVPADDLIVICAGRRKVEIDVPFPVHQLGHIEDRDALATFYSAADVTVVPSLEETFSNTAAESIACGTPVVGFETGAIPTLAREGRGRTAPVGDVIGLAAAAREVLSWKTVDRQGAHDYMRVNHAPELIGRRYGRLFEELAHRARSVAEPPAYREQDQLAVYLAARLTAISQQQKARAVVGSAIGGGDAFTGLGRAQGLLEVTPALSIAEGVERDGVIRIPVMDAAGHRVHGPYMKLEPGDYLVVARFKGGRRLKRSRLPWRKPAKGQGKAVIDIAWNVHRTLIAQDVMIDGVIPEPAISLAFTLPPEDKVKEGLEIRLWTDGKAPMEITEVILKKL